jgi:hypothetical protein
MTIMQSVDDMSEAAQIAYRAFIDMSRSKQAHFSLLETIETRYQSGGAPSLAENLELQKLLENHDRNVLAFTTALAAVTDSAERERLIELMS